MLTNFKTKLKLGDINKIKDHCFNKYCNNRKQNVKLALLQLFKFVPLQYYTWAVLWIKVLAAIVTKPCLSSNEIAETVCGGHIHLGTERPSSNSTNKNHASETTKRRFSLICQRSKTRPLFGLLPYYINKHFLSLPTICVLHTPIAKSKKKYRSNFILNING